MRTLLRWFVICLTFLPESNLVAWCLGVVPASEERVVALCSVGGWLWGAMAVVQVVYGLVAPHTPTTYAMLAVGAVLTARVAWACCRRAQRPAPTR